MRALLQVVDHASVDIDGERRGAIGQGFLVFLGIGPEDGKEEAEMLWNKIYKLRVFLDPAGKMNCSLDQIGGEVLIISQFTLYADCRKGNRPSFTAAAPPAQAEALYEYFLELAEKDMGHVEHGEFGAEMSVNLLNQGPCTILLDTDELKRPRRQ